MTGSMFEATSVTAKMVLQEHSYSAPRPVLRDINTLPSTGACGGVRPIHNVKGPAAISCNKVCRICLAADRKMFVLDTKHKQLYESVTGITVQPIDRLPKHICWECNHFMAKLMRFQIKAVTSHCILMKILTNKNFTTLEKHQPKSTLACTRIWNSNLDGVDHEELDKIVAVDDEDVTKIKNEADLVWEEERNFTSYDNGEINVISDNKPIDYINKKANFTTKETRGETYCSGIWYSNLDGVDYEELDEIATVDDENVTEIKNEADLIWEDEIIFTSYDNGEINVISDNKPIDYINEEANFTTKETRRDTFDIITNIEMTKENVSSIEIPEEIVRNKNDIEIKEKPVKNLHNIKLPDYRVKNDTDIETTEKTAENLINNDILDILPGDDVENEFCVSNESDETSSKSIKNISSEPIDEQSKSKRKLEFDKTLRTVTILTKEKQISEMKNKVVNYNNVNLPLKCSSCFMEFLDIDTMNRHMEVHSKTPAPADGRHCERSGLRFASQEAFDDHKTCSANLADKRTTKITPRLAEPMVVNGIQFAKSPRVELRKYYAPPGYAPLFGAPLKKPKADSLKVKNSSKTSHEDSLKTVYSDANIPELSKRTKRLVEAKEKANCTETVVGDTNDSLIETCEDKFICDECGQQFHKKAYIILHMKTKHVKDIDIRFPNYAYSSVTKDRLSKLNCEKRKYFCDECNNRFISKNILKRHIQRCGIKNNVSNTQSALEPYLCTKCGMNFILKHGFIRHMRTHTGEKSYSCTVCKKQFSRSSNLNIHMRTHTGEKPYSCTVCKKQFSRSSNLNIHMRTHTGEKPYSCTVCSKPFSQSGHLDRHMRTHTGEKPCSCTVCKKQFSQSYYLDLHMRTHTGDKPYSCTVCSKQFSLPGNLSKHMRKHTGEKPYSCTVCKKQFSRSDNLRNHMRTHTGEKPGNLSKHMRKHTGEKPYSCIVCKKQFSRSDNLRNHMRTHTGEKPYSCTVCKKQFSQIGHLDRHMRTHTGEKPYSCTVCKKQFSQSCNLDIHMRTHTGEKPYSCTVCSKQFSQSYNLDKHMRTHTGETPYSCKVCKKQFSRSDHWNNHMRTHKGEKPYSCSVCKKRFSNNSNWRRHSKTCQ